MDRIDDGVAEGRGGLNDLPARLAGWPCRRILLDFLFGGHSEGGLVDRQHNARSLITHCCGPHARAS